MENYYEEYWEQRIDIDCHFNRERAIVSRLVPIMTLVGKRRFSRVFDLGCGDGLTLSQILSRWPEVKALGVDISRGALSLITDPRIARVRGDIQGHIPLKDALFDLVISLETLEHLANPQLALREMLRVAEANALFIVSIPNEGYLKNRLRRQLGLRQDSYLCSPRDHLQHWELHEFVDLLVSNGFAVKRIMGAFDPRLRLFIPLPSVFSYRIFFAMEKASFQGGKGCPSTP